MNVAKYIERAADVETRASKCAMRTFIYKRTHKGDPDKNGWFGIYDCMGKDRGFRYDAVIGVGGIGAEAKAAGIDWKVNWIGIGPRKTRVRGMRGPLVTFEHFVLYEEKGQEFHTLAPRLARRMYSNPAPRFIFNDDFSGPEQVELDTVLQMAWSKAPSAGLLKNRPRAKRGRCPRPCCFPYPSGK
jgi:hypothetical protein